MQSGPHSRPTLGFQLAAPGRRAAEVAHPWTAHDRPRGGNGMLRILRSGGSVRFGMRWLGPALSLLTLAGLGAACTGGGSSANPAAAPQISYDGARTWSITGSAGGPFSNGSMDVALSNAGTQIVGWSVSARPAFVQLDQVSGDIHPGGEATIHAALDTTLAQSFPVGDHVDTLTIHNDSAQQTDISIACSLSVTTPEISTQLLPLTDFVCSGQAGGPFQPASLVYALTDTGSSPVGW